MNQFAKLAVLAVVTLGMASVHALSYEKKSTNDNWGDGASELVWKNGTDELCWRNNSWTPATANVNCDGAIVAQRVAPVVEQPIVKPGPTTPDVEPNKPVEPVVTTEKVTLEADALFDFDKAVIKPEGKAKLDNMLSKLKDITVEVIVATGHTDSIGAPAYNQKLSVRRANAVKDYLVKHGVDPKNVFAEGKGETKPIASNKTKAGRAKNRRVDIEVVGTRSK